MRIAGQIVARLLRFASSDASPIRPGTVLAGRVQDALLRISKLTDDAARKNPHRLVPPADSGLTGTELVAAYLSKSPFFELLTVATQFAIPRDRWATHTAIIGPSEWGKSEIIGLYLREALEDPEPRAIFLLDPHGDLMKKALPRVPSERLIVIDPDTNPPDLN